MKLFISEDNIEQAICNRLALLEYGWQRIRATQALTNKTTYH